MHFRSRSNFVMPLSSAGTIIKLLITSMDETGHTFYSPLPKKNILYEFSLLVTTFAMTLYILQLWMIYIDRMLQTLFCYDDCYRDESAVSWSAPNSAIGTSIISWCRHQVLPHILGDIRKSLRW